MTMKVVGVIPARFNSTRFPGKPLIDLCGHPMVWWVYNNMKKSSYFDQLVVATDDEKIKQVCIDNGMNVLMTSTEHETGTDRVVEVSKKIDADLYVVIMGDEPLIEAVDVDKLILAAEKTEGIAFMLITKFKNPVDVVNTTTIKIAINDESDVIFMSRQPIPYPKSSLGYDYFKNMGAYAFRKNALKIYEKTEKGRIERAEDLEMLRLIEKHCLVKAIEVDSESMSVDTLKDAERIRGILKTKYNKVSK